MQRRRLIAYDILPPSEKPAAYEMEAMKMKLWKNGKKVWFSILSTEKQIPSA